MLLESMETLRLMLARVNVCTVFVDPTLRTASMATWGSLLIHTYENENECN